MTTSVQRICFYFNFLQIPPGNPDKGNQMILLSKKRLKDFYRPANLKGRNKNLLDDLTFSRISTSHIRIINHSPYDISLGRLEVKTPSQKRRCQ
ncbi:fimbrial biogenesis chaperone [Erwinia persicina]|uniref:fimbrial biogenesis chaperone n=1 Tax=Erwinia persicina TaxID=55211 RepID=UPI00177D800D|nr:molecular chaperone [Erwinia persicina]